MQGGRSPGRPPARGVLGFRIRTAEIREHSIVKEHGALGSNCRIGKGGDGGAGRGESAGNAGEREGDIYFWRVVNGEMGRGSTRMKSDRIVIERFAGWPDHYRQD
jgi:hypothetical protein